MLCCSADDEGTLSEGIDGSSTSTSSSSDVLGRVPTISELPLPTVVLACAAGSLFCGGFTDFAAVAGRTVLVATATYVLEEGVRELKGEYFGSGKFLIHARNAMVDVCDNKG